MQKFVKRKRAKCVNNARRIQGGTCDGCQVGWGRRVSRLRQSTNGAATSLVKRREKKVLGLSPYRFFPYPLSLSLALCDVRTLSSNLPPLFRRRCPSLVRGCAAYVATLVVSGSPGGWACHTHAHTQKDIHMCVCAKWFRWGKRSGNCKFFTRMRKNKSYAWNVWIGPAHHWESCKQDNNIRCTVEQMQKAQR